MAAGQFDFAAHLRRQREFSERTFGPGARTTGVVDHITKELREILDKPDDLSEWIDVAILALDGAWRAGYTPEQIIAALVAKQSKNEARVWPDWRTVPEGKAIEHDRSVSRQPTNDAPENIIEGIQRQQRRCMELLVEYKRIGPAGAFGTLMITRDIQEGDAAIASGDVVRMLRAYKALEGCN